MNTYKNNKKYLIYIMFKWKIWCKLLKHSNEFLNNNIYKSLNFYLKHLKQFNWKVSISQILKSNCWNQMLDRMFQSLNKYKPHIPNVHIFKNVCVMNNLQVVMYE